MTIRCQSCGHIMQDWEMMFDDCEGCRYDRPPDDEPERDPWPLPSTDSPWPKSPPEPLK